MATTTKAPEVRHEDFCITDEPRIEQFTAYRDGDHGRSVPAVTVTRCLECGATKYAPVN